MNPKIVSGISTAAIVALVVVVLLAFGYDPPDPPIPEEGVEVNVGNSDFGLGRSANPASEASRYAPPAAQQQVATQQTEPSMGLPSSPRQGDVTNPAATEQPQTQSKEPELNPNASFPGMRNRAKDNGSGSQGVSTGTGDQGKPDGNPNSNNYAGNGGGKGTFSLKGRSAVSLPEPTYKSNTQGTVVIKIWVDKNGRVTRAEYQPKGSNTSDGYLVGQARSAALKARFNASPNAPEEQVGTITYLFKI